jgi:hypothetical protein
MKLLESLQNIQQQTDAIRNSLKIERPGRESSVNEHEGLTRQDRLVGMAKAGGHRRAVGDRLLKLMADVKEGRVPAWHLKEAMSTSDFPLLFGDNMYRMMLGNYQPWPVTYPSYFRVVDVQDFRTLNMFTLDGGKGLLDKVSQYAPYPEVAFTEGRYQVSVAKYGRRYGVSFEMGINDDLNAFSMYPSAMAEGARRSEEYLATTMLADVNGPHATFFSATNGNLISGNPNLDIAGLQKGMTLLSSFKDSDGQPIYISGVKLVVGPALEITAQNMLAAREFRIGEVGGTSGQLAYVSNWLTARLTLSVNPYIPYISTSNTKNQWYLIADPAGAMSRPAFVFAFMTGRRTPQLFQKDSNQVNLGGGDADVMEGNFENDGIDYKLRHIYGAAQVDPKMAVASFGS